jgi:outer membrane protein assembly factor BamB
VASGEPIADAWPDGGPRRLWDRPLGEGYAGIAAVGDALYAMYRRGDDEVVVSLDAGTGRTRWEHVARPAALEGMNLVQGQGPHATPLVHHGLVFAAGVTGHLRALDARSGALRWERRLIEDLGGNVVMRGYSSSPVALDDLVVVQSGGEGHAVTAFRVATGEIAWRGGTFENVSSSPVVAEIAGERQVIALGSGEVTGLDAATGTVQWTHPHPHRFGENIPMPLWSHGQLFVTSYADGGSRVLEFARDDDAIRVIERWHHRRMRLYYTNAVRLGNAIYGSSGDLGPTVFTAVDAATGDVRWQTRDVARSHLIVVGDLLIMRDDEGRLTLARPTRAGANVLASAVVFEAGPPSPPALRDGRLFARDRLRIVAFDLR